MRCGNCTSLSSKSRLVVLAGCRDHFSKIEYPFNLSPTVNKPDAIEAVEIALAEYERPFGRALVEAWTSRSILGR